MTQKITYQAARAVAPTIEDHFARHLAAARLRGEQALAPAPHTLAIEAIIDVAFWASLLREEGRSPKISLAYLPPDRAEQAMQFERSLRLTPGVLTKLAPAVERPGVHLCVWPEDDALYVWGATRDIPGLCFVLEVVEPGLLVVKHRRISGYGKFANVAVLRGEQVKVVDGNSSTHTDSSDLLTSMLGFTTASASSRDYAANVLIQLAVSMRDHGRGGTLLIVPAETESWHQSIIHPIPYAVEPPFSGLKELVERSEQEWNQSQWQGDLQRAVDSVAGLTAVDGATIISDQYELMAFGAKIGRPEGNAPVAQIVTTEPIAGGRASIIHPAQSGGTRHLSAAQFVHDQHDALALVASQDGRFTVFSWSPLQEMVHAHRIDTLLL